jgi:hypothetical protein
MRNYYRATLFIEVLPVLMWAEIFRQIGFFLYAWILTLLCIGFLVWGTSKK